MRFDINKGSEWVEREVPNGGLAILDKNDKLIAYVKDPVNTDGWDWVRADCRT